MGTVDDNKLNRLNDRCDNLECNAQAFVMVGNGNGRLIFCGHHFRRHEVGLLMSGFSILEDIRDTINTKPTSGFADTPGQEGRA